MSESAGLAGRIDTIERGYEYLLAYAAQGRQEEAGTEARPTLVAMHAALIDLAELAMAEMKKDGVQFEVNSRADAFFK